MNKMSVRVLLLFCIITMVSTSIFADNNASDSLKSFYENNYQEVVFIHADKDQYVAGEFIKFKVYCLERLTSTPSKLSKVAYVEILDHENTPHFQARIELKNGSGHGELYIPTSAPSGHFIIRGYTRWMRNYGPQSYYHSMLTIINPFKRPGLSPKPMAENASLQFFPEGGKLINGIASKIVFQGKDANGYPMDFKAKLIANDTVSIETFSSLYQGLGSFTLIPDAKAKYKVEMTNEDGEVTSHPFLPIVETGTTLQVNVAGSTVKIGCTGENSPMLDGPVSLIVYQNDMILDQRKVALKPGVNPIHINLSNFKSGIARVDIYSHGNLMLSRVVFRQEKERPLTMELDSRSFSSRERVSIDLAPYIEGFDPGTADLSISVSNQNKQLQNCSMDFRHFLLLQNQLNTVYNIESYFDAPVDKVEALVNDLLIAYATQPNYEVGNRYIAEYRCPLVTGKLFEKQTKKPAYSIGAYISVPGKHLKFYATKSMKDGELIFETPDLYGNNEIVAQVDYTKDSAYTVELDNPYSEDYLHIDLPVFDLDESLESWIVKQSQNIQVQNANLKFAPKMPLYTVVDSTSFYKKPTHSYKLDDYTRFVVMEEVMREYVAGVNVRKNKNGFYFKVYDNERNIIYDGDPLLLMDGVPVFDADEIMAVDPLKVERIETVNTRFGRGVLDCQGIVSYTTYSGNLDGFSIHKDARVLTYDGVQLQKRYSFPDYGSEKAKRSPTPDFRNTLYWNPLWMKDGDESKEIEFYTSDSEGTYEITINGLDSHGNILSIKGTLEVSPKIN